MMSVFHLIDEFGFTVDEIDKLTGPIIGRPKSATFRTIDVVGLDTLVHTANGVFKNAPDDEMHDTFKIPDFMHEMVKRKLLGEKTGGGFYRKDGKEIKTLDWKTFEYRDRWYSVLAVTIDDYRQHMTQRSPKWQTVSVPAEPMPRRPVSMASP